MLFIFLSQKPSSLSKCRSSIDMHHDMYLPTQHHLQPSINDFHFTTSGVDNRPLDSSSSSMDQKQITATAETTTTATNR